MTGEGLAGLRRQTRFDPVRNSKVPTLPSGYNLSKVANPGAEETPDDAHLAGTAICRWLQPHFARSLAPTRPRRHLRLVSRLEVFGISQCFQEPFRHFAAFWAIEITTEFLFVGMAMAT
jgi:hypothetical protein